MEFRILGPVGVWKDGREIQLDGSKQRTVLTALLLARQDRRVIRELLRPASRATREIPAPRVRRVFPERQGLPVHKAPLARKVRRALPARLEQRVPKGLPDQLARLGRKV